MSFFPGGPRDTLRTTDAWMLFTMQLRDPWGVSWSAPQLQTLARESVVKEDLMKAVIGSASCVALVLAATMAVRAQDQTSSQSSSTQSASAKTLTVTGCVARAEEHPTGTTGMTGTTESKFVLTNASPKTGETAGTSGTTAPEATAIASEYKLDADDAKLTEHVGHKVEISGTVQPPSRAEQKPPASAANAPTLKVDSVKMIASSCQ
jgi:hypothetical protein